MPSVLADREIGLVVPLEDDSDVCSNPLVLQHAIYGRPVIAGREQAAVYW